MKWTKKKPYWWQRANFTVYYMSDKEDGENEKKEKNTHTKYQSVHFACLSVRL